MAHGHSRPNFAFRSIFAFDGEFLAIDDTTYEAIW